ncbi:MAG: hypothetical protein ACYCPT_09145 [Acidimicrobiales bacterium]
MHQSSILIFRGISIDSLKKYAASSNSIKNLNTNFPQLYVYNNIPTTFSTTEKWVKTSNLLCWHCDTLFMQYPKFIPISINKNDNDFVYNVIGNFCSWNCALAHAKFLYNNTEHLNEIIALLYDACSKFRKKRVLKLIESPPKTIMQQYCGPGGITRDQYIEKINELDALTIYLISN